ncbi:hypothetical protein CROQUDRAFT_88408 [Cronartium quercuum f. sp. fusiforme G11]|uniref:Argonaute linker 1 domain-containing protein n=1 Tax=Cronartium quercuum f. sp. fusiforme G11 TaxID=708437 RepID=A0A9P6TFV3_9BASI|nr:hypothetical protein CROQUDRAFT_88408 [Cronartium quercuum f. sp. fusiforme G11]
MCWLWVKNENNQRTKKVLCLLSSTSHLDTDRVTPYSLSHDSTTSSNTNSPHFTRHRYHPLYQALTMQLIKKPPTSYPALNLGFCINLVLSSATNSGILVQSQPFNITSVSITNRPSISTWQCWYCDPSYHQCGKLPSNIIYHYDLAIKDLVGKGGRIGDVPPKFGQEIFSNLKDKVKAFGNISVAYDGRKNFVVDMSVGKNSRKFTIIIALVNVIKSDNLVKYVNRQVNSTPDEGIYNAINAINALSIMCNHDLMLLHPCSKNQFFPLPPGPGDGLQLKYLKGGIEIWQGYFSSIHMVPNGVVLNFDLSSQPIIRHGYLAKVAAEIAGLGCDVRGLVKLHPQAITRLIQALRSIKVTVHHQRGWQST